MFIVRSRGRPASHPQSFIGILRYPVAEPRLYIVQAPLGMWTNAGAGGEYLASEDAHGLSVHVCANDCDKPPLRRQYEYGRGGRHHVGVYVYGVEVHAYANGCVGLATRQSARKLKSRLP